MADRKISDAIVKQNLSRFMYTPKEKKYKKEKINAALRHAVWAKYMGTSTEGKCQCCQCVTIAESNFHAGHVTAERNGGKTDLDNLRPICMKCNGSMGTQNMDDFIKNNGFKQSSMANVNPPDLISFDITDNSSNMKVESSSDDEPEANDEIVRLFGTSKDITEEMYLEGLKWNMLTLSMLLKEAKKNGITAIDKKAIVLELARKIKAPEDVSEYLTEYIDVAEEYKKRYEEEKNKPKGKLSLFNGGKEKKADDGKIDQIKKLFEVSQLEDQTLMNLLKHDLEQMCWFYDLPKGSTKALCVSKLKGYTMKDWESIVGYYVTELEKLPTETLTKISGLTGTKIDMIKHILKVVDFQLLPINKNGFKYQTTFDTLEQIKKILDL